MPSHGFSLFRIVHLSAPANFRTLRLPREDLDPPSSPCHLSLPWPCCLRALGRCTGPPRGVTQDRAVCVAAFTEWSSCEDLTALYGRVTGHAWRDHAADPSISSGLLVVSAVYISLRVAGRVCALVGGSVGVGLWASVLNPGRSCRTSPQP